MLIRSFTAAAWLAGVIAVALPVPAVAAQLIRSETQATVYAVDGQNVRHTYPNAATYRSWYGDDYSGVTVVAPDELAGFPLGSNVTLRPGKWLVKVPSSPTVYAVEQGGVLRPIANAEVAAGIFGPRWAGKVVDIPEAFFSDYTVGESLAHAYELPGSIVYQIKGKPAWYWKRGNLLQPFASWADVSTNGYGKEDVIVGSRDFPVRTRSIVGASPLVSDPFAPSTLSTEDCGASPFTVAIVLVSRGALEVGNIAALDAVRTRLPETFRWATRELGAIDASYPVVVLPDDGLLTVPTEQGGRKLTDEAVQTFYDNNPDAFDFLMVFTDFAVQLDQPNEIARQVMVTNAVTGLDLPQQNAADQFGSRGKLKSVLLFYNIQNYDVTTDAGRQRLDNLLLHEIAHQWSAAVKFRVGDYDSTALLRDDGRHWSYYASFISPLGGSGWRDNGDGTFTSLQSQQMNTYRWPYADLDLYLMGLLPWQAVTPFSYVIPATPGVVGNTIAGRAQTVTIDQVIAANGQRRCELATKAGRR
ncbi:MAG: hypothetical protein PHI63_02530 [Patescibacteria group bacterium]|nr:hypothetical protein [Patescibacteria group bacterium]